MNFRFKIYIKKIISSITMNILIISLFFIFGCEDDAILKPQTESDCTGSYCSLNLPSFIKKYKSVNPDIF